MFFLFIFIKLLFIKFTLDLIYKCNSGSRYSDQDHVIHLNFQYQSELQKQPFKGVLRKRCSENMQQFYRRTPMPKGDLQSAKCKATLLKSNFGMGFLL